MQTLTVSATDKRSCDSILNALRAIRPIIANGDGHHDIRMLAEMSLVIIQTAFPDAMLCETSGAELIVGSGIVLMEFRHG